MSNTKSNGLIAGICFILFSILGLFNTISGYMRMSSYSYFEVSFLRFSWSALLTAALTVAFAIALFMDNVSMAKIMKILSLVFVGYISISNIIAYIRLGMVLLAISSILNVIIEVMAVVALIKVGKGSQTFCYIAGGLTLLGQIVVLLAHNFVTANLRYILVIVGYLFLGMYLASKEKGLASANSREISNSGNTIEKLSNLRDLLDKGIITQNEFNEKKNQILGS